jgi:transcriptional regulator with XRE-family HTH domain
LASKARVSSSTIRDFEAGRRIPHANNLTAIRSAFEGAGMGFQFGEDGSPMGIAVTPKAVRKKRAKG